MPAPDVEVVGPRPDGQRAALDPAASPPAERRATPAGEAVELERDATWHPFTYALIRLVPHIERGECLNLGVVLYCRPLRFLAGRFEVDEPRLRAFAPGLDLDAVRAHLTMIDRVCAGDPADGPIAALPQPERFGWIVGPASTIVQPGPVHPGLCRDPAAELDHLFMTMVRLGRSSAAT